MKVTETLSEGLKRELQIVIPAADLEAKLDAKLNELKGTVRLNGFRPGKVPFAHMKKTYGRSVMSEIMQEEINASVTSTLEERKEKPAVQPAIDMSEDQGVINDVIEGKADLDFSVKYETLPKVELADFAKIKVERPVVEVSDEMIDEQVAQIVTQNRPYKEKDAKGKVEQGDKIGFSHVGTIDGEVFEGGSTDHGHLVIGSGQYIPGFEDQLVGLKKGEKKDVKLTFPEDYQSEDLAGKKAVFACEILHIDGPDGDVELDDEFAKKLGVDSVDALKDAIKTQIEGQYGTMTRARVKRQILDGLDDGHKFDVPQILVDNEFNGIWERVTHEIEHHGKTFEDEDTTEEEARALYTKISERRVRLGLVIAEAGDANEVTISDEEMQGALMAEIRRHPGQEQEVWDFFRNTPAAMTSLRAPLFEDKVVDHIITVAKVTDKTVTPDELTKLASEEDEE